MDKVFHQSAGLGDAIYALPTIKLMGGGTFVYGNRYKGYLALKPLLERQPYIKEVKHISEVSLPNGFVNLDLFRNSSLGNKAHLVDLHLDYFGFPHYNWNSGGWLQYIPAIPPITNQGYAVINVTSRYRDKVFQRLNFWEGEIRYLKNKDLKLFFLGDPEDHFNFEIITGQKIEYLPTKDLLEAAGIIKHAAMFSGTQSSLLAIREALNLPYRFEWSPNHIDVCQFSRNEHAINKITRKIHLAITTTKRLLNAKQ